ncbi:MAG: exodeoxyribonuclease III [Tissierellia bacterium]|nr:exodeoxyribonuclease III [Tissierellia bacterium]
MKLISWNVNGIRACYNKGFEDSFKKLDADVFSVQEIKMKPDQKDINMEGYYLYINSAEKPGYSGTATWTKEEPLSVQYGIGIEKHDQEGRVITLEFENFYHVNCYTPNSQRKLARLDYRMEWEDDFREYLKSLDQKKPVILCGDLNVAHKEIDLKNPSSNRKNAGFSDEERAQMTNLLDAGFTDTFRFFYPDKEEEYSWWSYITRARDRNAGWRIDYFVTSKRLNDALIDAKIHQDIFGSDHCPVELELDPSALS